MLEQERRQNGKAFHIVGAANEKERLPIALRILGTERSMELVDRRVREG